MSGLPGRSYTMAQENGAANTPNAEERQEEPVTGFDFNNILSSSGMSSNEWLEQRIRSSLSAQADRNQQNPDDEQNSDDEQNPDDQPNPATSGGLPMFPPQALRYVGSQQNPGGQRNPATYGRPSMFSHQAPRPIGNWQNGQPNPATYGVPPMFLPEMLRFIANQQNLGGQRNPATYGGPSMFSHQAPRPIGNWQNGQPNPAMYGGPPMFPPQALRHVGSQQNPGGQRKHAIYCGPPMFSHQAPRRIGNQRNPGVQPNPATLAGSLQASRPTGNRQNPGDQPKAVTSNGPTVSIQTPQSTENRQNPGDQPNAVTSDRSTVSIQTPQSTENRQNPGDQPNAVTSDGPTVSLQTPQSTENRQNPGDQPNAVTSDGPTVSLQTPQSTKDRQNPETSDGSSAPSTFDKILSELSKLERSTFRKWMDSYNRALFMFSMNKGELSVHDQTKWWESFTEQFFEDNATMLVSLMKGPIGHAETVHTYEYTRRLIPRYYQIIFESGVKKMRYIFIPSDMRAGATKLRFEELNISNEYDQNGTIETHTKCKLKLELILLNGYRVNKWIMDMGNTKEFILENGSFTQRKNKITQWGLYPDVVHHLNILKGLKPDSIELFLSKHKNTPLIHCLVEIAKKIKTINIGEPEEQPSTSPSSQTPESQLQASAQSQALESLPQTSSQAPQFSPETSTPTPESPPQTSTQTPKSSPETPESQPKKSPQNETRRKRNRESDPSRRLQSSSSPSEKKNLSGTEAAELGVPMEFPQEQSPSTSNSQPSQPQVQSLAESLNTKGGGPAEENRQEDEQQNAPQREKTIADGVLRDIRRFFALVDEKKALPNRPTDGTDADAEKTGSTCEICFTEAHAIYFGNILANIPFESFTSALNEYERSRGEYN